MARPRAALVSLLGVLAMFPVPAEAIVGSMRPPLAVQTEQYGQLAPAPGLEFIGLSPQAVLGVYSTATGALIAPLLPSQSVIQGTRHIVDFDGDGLGEILTVWEHVVTEIGLQVLSGSAMTAVFPNVLLDDTNVRYIGTMRLNSANPNAMVFQGAFGVAIVRQNGTIRYRSDADSNWPAPANYEMTVSIADFAGNGFDQLNVVLDAGDQGPKWNVLIGDTAPGLVAADAPITARARLLPARPNPARGSASIAFELPHATDVELRIYDSLGRLVTRLASGPMAAGRHQRIWDGRDTAGGRVAAGAYFYELVVDGAKETRKLIELR